jgi:hypothetical protein
MIAEYDLLARWFGVADWCAYTLQKDGSEALVLSPLGKFPASAAMLSEKAFESDNFRHRKIAASLLGWIEAPLPDVISEFLDREAKRDSSLPPEGPARLECQSVVEDLVFSAARWARSDETLPTALAFLTDVVKRTIGGEYWNSSSYAMTTLMHHDPTEYDDLLVRFSRYTQGPAPIHPSRPTLEQERQFAENLIQRNPNTLRAIDTLLNEKDDALAADLDAESKQSISELLSVAAEFEKTAK